jgi:hypothetical protein
LNLFYISFEVISHLLDFSFDALLLETCCKQKTEITVH